MLLEDGEDAVDVNVLCICNHHGAAAPTRPPVPASLLLGLPIANCPRPRPPSPPPLSSPLLSPVSPHSQCSFSSPSLLDIAERAYRHAAKHAAAAPESLSGGRVDSGHHQGDSSDRVRLSVRQTLSFGRPARPRPRERGPEIERLLSERDRDRFAFVTRDGVKLWRDARKRDERRGNANAIYRGAAK